MKSARLHEVVDPPKGAHPRIMDLRGAGEDL
jgi:hypothetical protein